MKIFQNKRDDHIDILILIYYNTFIFINMKYNIIKMKLYFIIFCKI